MRLWDLAAEQQVGEDLRRHADDVRAVAFSPDGGSLASGGDDGSVVLWTVSTDKWRQQACALAGRNLDPREWQKLQGRDTAYRKTCPDLP